MFRSLRSCIDLAWEWHEVWEWQRWGEDLGRVGNQLRSRNFQHTSPKDVSHQCIPCLIPEANPVKELWLQINLSRVRADSL